MKKNKYVCKNCGAGQDRKYVVAMLDAGFGLCHLSCAECGQNTVAENERLKKRK